MRLCYTVPNQKPTSSTFDPGGIGVVSLARVLRGWLAT